MPKRDELFKGSNAMFAKCSGKVEGDRKRFLGSYSKGFFGRVWFPYTSKLERPLARKVSFLGGPKTVQKTKNKPLENQPISHELYMKSLTKLRAMVESSDQSWKENNSSSSRESLRDRKLPKNFAPKKSDVCPNFPWELRGAPIHCPLTSELGWPPFYRQREELGVLSDFYPMPGRAPSLSLLAFIAYSRVPMRGGLHRNHDRVDASPLKDNIDRIFGITSISSLYPGREG